jgi:hypothetical protein
MFARIARTTSFSASLGLILAGSLAVACGGAPDAGSESAHDDSVASPLAPSACHGAANAGGIVGISCDSFSPLATGYALERFQRGSWVVVDGPSGKTPDLTDEGSSASPNNGPPADPTYPRNYHVRAEVPEGAVYSAPIEVVAPQ